MNRAAVAAVVLVVAGCAVSPAATVRSAPYERAAFGTGWADVDQDGCDTRAETLMKWMTGEHVRDAAHGGCLVESGRLFDPYTRERATVDASTVDIDHVVALADAWRAGAADWTAQERVDFANDPANLAPTSSTVNRGKGDRGPDQWSPANHAAACWYTRQYQTVKTGWHLTLTAAQQAAVDETRATCR